MQNGQLLNTSKSTSMTFGATTMIRKLLHLKTLKDTQDYATKKEKKPAITASVMPIVTSVRNNISKTSIELEITDSASFMWIIRIYTSAGQIPNHIVKRAGRLLWCFRNTEAFS